MPDKDKENTENKTRTRSFWSGTITFGLVSVPVSLFPANSAPIIRFKMVDDEGTLLRRQYFCPADNAPVSSDDLVRGYEIDDGNFIIIKDDELEALQPEKTREIDLKRFVDLSDVNPVYFERAYFLAPEGNSTKAYRLLASTMEKSGRAGIATFIMREKEYLIAIIAEAGILRAETLRFHDEIRSPADVGLPEIGKAPADKVKRIKKEIEARTDDSFNPELLRDDYAERVRAAVEAKLDKGEDVFAVPEDDDDERGDDEPVVIDLMEVLKHRFQQSVEETGGEAARN